MTYPPDITSPGPSLVRRGDVQAFPLLTGLSINAGGTLRDAAKRGRLLRVSGFCWVSFIEITLVPLVLGLSKHVLRIYRQALTKEGAWGRLCQAKRHRASGRKQ